MLERDSAFQELCELILTPSLETERESCTIMNPDNPDLLRAQGVCQILKDILNISRDAREHLSHQTNSRPKRPTGGDA